MKLVTLTCLLFISAVSMATGTASFSCDVTHGCSPLLVHMTGHSTGATTWRWNLGNGNTSSQQNPSATYATPGIYHITLVASNGTQTDSSTQTIIVNGIPSIDFTASRNTACIGDSIAFDATISTAGSAPIDHFAWSFGNGAGSSIMNTSYRYSQSGLYSVTLVARDTNGCTASLTKPAYIRVWPTPVASYSLTPATTCGTSQTVTFTDQSQGTGLSYALAFGDGGMATTANTTHTYSYGRYNSRLTVTSANGCTASTVKAVAVINLAADFRSDKQTVCTGEQVTFENRSPMAGTSWLWLFGDGTTSTRQNPTHVYTGTGVYAVTFIIRDGSCTDTITRAHFITVNAGFAVSFTPDNRRSCDVPFVVHFTSQVSTNSPVTYAWQFNNGHLDSTANPTTTYTVASIYNVSLTVTDTNGCTVSTAVPGLITAGRPKPKFLCDTATCPGTRVSFSNRSQNAAFYFWNFGDGDTAIGPAPAHIFHTSGDYTVSLRAMDSTGCDSLYSVVVHVSAPVVDFRASQSFSTCPPLVTTFHSMTNRSGLRFKWSFGDGTTDTASNPTHIYSYPGVYTVSLVATATQGCSDSVVYNNLITVQGPTGHFSVTGNSGCVPLTVSFSGFSPSNIQTVTCDLGNGILHTGAMNFNYTYTDPRVYYPRFVLTDQVGCSVPFDLDSILAVTTPVLDVHDTSVCYGQTVRMALGTDHYTWTATACDTCGRVPSTTDTIATALLSPSVNTTYTIHASNNLGCSATGTFHINVQGMQELPARDTVRICHGENAQLGTVTGDSVIWTPSIYLSDSTSLSPFSYTVSSMRYTARSFDAHGCSYSQDIPVKVVQQVRVLITPDTTVCPDAAIQLQVAAIDSSVQSGVQYHWYASPDLNRTTGQTVTAQVHASDETFHVMTTSGTCWPDTSAITVHVRSYAHVELPEQMTVVVNGEIPLHIESGDISTYHWAVSGRGELSCSDCMKPAFRPAEDQVVTLTGTNQYGCTASDTMLIHVLPCDPEDIFVANTFTPNGDGLHDKVLLHSRTLTQLDYFRVYDRWGAIVFESHDVAEGWDGTISGEAAAQGVYLYTVRGKCDSGYTLEKNGTITLVR